MNEFELEQLVLEAQSGDGEAFGQLVSHFEPVVYAIVLRRLRNTSEAREVTQEVFLRALRKLSQLREPNRFAGWLKRIAIRMAINRAVRRPKETISSPENFSGLAGRETAAPIDNLMAGERAASVRDGIDQLKELDRQTLIAFYFQGQSLKEMSVRFDSPVGTIKRRLHTARSRLKDQLVDLQPA